MADVLVSMDGQVATLTINRPHKGNAISLDALATMEKHLVEFASSPVRALVITGAGERTFSAGMDLSDVSDPGAWAINPLTRFCDLLERFPKPTIARINGAVIGGATEIALSCDLRIGVDTTKLRVPAIDLGVHYEFEGLARAVSQLGSQPARRIYMLGEKLDASAMTAIGFLDRCVSQDALDTTINDILDVIRAGAPLAVNGAKMAISEILAGEDATEAKKRIKQARASEDLQEGLAAVREKRRPDFNGV